MSSKARKERPGGQTTTRLLVREGGKCGYCGFDFLYPQMTTAMWTQDHVLPKSWGGNPFELLNLLLACKHCNSIKCCIEQAAEDLLPVTCSMRELVEKFYDVMCGIPASGHLPGMEGRFKKLSLQARANMIYHVFRVLEEDEEKCNIRRVAKMDILRTIKIDDRPTRTIAARLEIDALTNEV